jgi:hypothetical protein
LGVGLGVGLVFGLGGLVRLLGVGLGGGLSGLGAFIRHWALRWQFQRAGSMPRSYVPFLDFCADHILLQRIGGGYRFIHALLLDYFAALYAEGAKDVPD